MVTHSLVYIGKKRFIRIITVFSLGLLCSHIDAYYHVISLFVTTLLVLLYLTLLFVKMRVLILSYNQKITTKFSQIRNKSIANQPQCTPYKDIRTYIYIYNT